VRALLIAPSLLLLGAAPAAAAPRTGTFRTGPVEVGGDQVLQQQKQFRSLHPVAMTQRIEVR